MMFPTVHLGGTSVDDLFAPNRNAFTRVREALEYLQKAAPNARDYYPQGPAAFTMAQAEHAARIDALQGVLSDLQEICGNLMGQKELREARKR